MVLHTNPFSTNGRRVALVVAQLGLDIETNIIDFATGANKAPDFLAINPNGQVPALVDDDLTLWESNAIAQYLCDVAREQGNDEAEALLPSDPGARADVMRWQCWQLAKWDDVTGPLLFECVLKPMLMGASPDPERVAKTQEKFRAKAALLDAALEGREWFVGDGPTLADFAIATPLMYAEGAQMPVGEFKNLAAWLARVRELPAWKATEPQRG
ncbi:MAG: glutathione S-transferase family protein [Alphaproteobacteria bacterium]|nr:glutathione S-transferase family protein [Alphaproteobacteria bacterium]